MGVRLVGVGVETFGYKDFYDGNFWAGELFVNEGKTIHKALRLAKKGITSGFGLFNSTARKRIKESKDRGFEGNLKGDGFQLGGTFVFDIGGDLLYEFRQENYGEHAPLGDILEALGGNAADAPDTSDISAPEPRSESECPGDKEELML
ncbi:uncharacterized protein AMSG_07723 [Thecamonas trahens ATCC 50062]|uniref:Uncharacterized protein n=1 Tax=Thecamonas trahens ATCC 50062 TaxID=461836 RepID=A0A0L0DHT2_THETB|nr:hypothetical protein AMSG_07723 [Thecamonas trahens ATCC 50062]KNC51661.1 hypothetical protein AMSG_07723 [Thecamonas trahens ATCC 50062]|eukprot:XP_013755797.1 hypothetical protein AMSG_07723 [Thecamonas trahens ATCC 50062]